MLLQRVLHSVSFCFYYEQDLLHTLEPGEKKEQTLCPKPHWSKGAGSRRCPLQVSPSSSGHPEDAAHILGMWMPLILSRRSLAVLFGYEKEPAMLMNYLNLSSTQLCKSDYLFKGSLAWNSL